MAMIGGRILVMLVMVSVWMWFGAECGAALQLMRRQMDDGPEDPNMLIPIFIPEEGVDDELMGGELKSFVASLQVTTESRGRFIIEILESNSKGGSIRCDAMKGALRANIPAIKGKYFVVLPMQLNGEAVSKTMDVDLELFGLFPDFEHVYMVLSYDQVKIERNGADFTLMGILLGLLIPLALFGGLILIGSGIFLKLKRRAASVMNASARTMKQGREYDNISNSTQNNNVISLQMQTDNLPMFAPPSSNMVDPMYNIEVQPPPQYSPYGMNPPSYDPNVAYYGPPPGVVTTITTTTTTYYEPVNQPGVAHAQQEPEYPIQQPFQEEQTAIENPYLVTHQ